MPNALDEYLKKASPAEKATLVENGLKLNQNGVELSNQTTTQQPAQSVEGRADVKQIGQDLKQSGAELKQDNYGPQAPPRVGESRPNAETPKYMDEQNPGDQKTGPGEKPDLKQADQQMGKDGQQNQQPRNEFERVKAADAQRESQAKAPEKEKTQQPAKSQEMER